MLQVVLLILNNQALVLLAVNFAYIGLLLHCILANGLFGSELNGYLPYRPERV